MQKMTIQFRKLTDTDQVLLEEVASIYEDLFPENERQPLETIKNRIDSHKTELLLALNEDRVVGFAITWSFEQSAFALLDYLAVHRDWHRKGVGPALMDEVKQSAKKQNKDLILEIERPGEGENQQQRAGRLRFYIRCGAFILRDVPYLLPALQGTVPTPMILMTIPANTSAEYSGQTIKELIRQIYLEVYNRGRDDKLLHSFIHSVPEKVELTKVWL
jgi:Predicted acetyltransferase